MATFHLTAEVTISVTTTIEADSEEQAREKATALGLPTLCYQCSRAGEDPEDGYWNVGSELDGEATIIECDRRDD